MKAKNGVMKEVEWPGVVPVAEERGVWMSTSIEEGRATIGVRIRVIRRRRKILS